MKAIDILKQLKQEEQRRKYPSVPDYALGTRKYSDKTANGLTKCIVEFLILSGWQAERINTTGIPRDKRQQVTDVLGRTKTIGSIEWTKGTSTKGSTDISATIKGKSVKIEVKIGKDRQSEDQKRYQEMIERAGGIYWIAKTFDDFYKNYQNLVSIDNINECENI